MTTGKLLDTNSPPKMHCSQFHETLGLILHRVKASNSSQLRMGSISPNVYGYGVACNYVLYTILSGKHYCICNNVRRTVLHMQLCPPGRCCICSCVRPVQNRPCSKLHALGRRNAFAIFLFGRLGIRFNHKIRKYPCCIRRFSACTLGHTYSHVKCPLDGFLSGADSIAWRTQLHLTTALNSSYVLRLTLS